MDLRLKHELIRREEERMGTWSPKRFDLACEDLDVLSAPPYIVQITFEKPGGEAADYSFELLPGREHRLSNRAVLHTVARIAEMLRVEGYSTTFRPKSRWHPEEEDCNGS